MRALLTLIVLLVLPSAPGARASVFADAFVSKLLARMTLEEKVGQLTQYATEDDGTLRESVRDEVAKGQVGSLFNVREPRARRELQHLATTRTRLKIPLLFALDITHGYRTQFPIPLAESSSWDLRLIEDTAAAAAGEAARDGVHWTFAPMVDVTRDARWGRVAFGAGEDPWWGAKVAAARVRGFQGKDLGDGRHLLATVKHFAGYGAVAAGREYAASDVTPRDLVETYLPPYEAAVKAGAAVVMTAGNALNGRPPSADRALLGDLLRRRWGFDGLILSDYMALPQLVTHGVAEDNRAAARLAAAAGVDVDLQGGVYAAQLTRLVKEGRVPRAGLDAAVRRVLGLKYRLGLFTNSERAGEDQPDLAGLAREAARRAIVLLKNDAGVLPLKRAGTLAVIGPFADDARPGGDGARATTLLAGLREVGGDQVKVIYARGANVLEDQALIDVLHGGADGALAKDPRTPQALIDEAVEAANKADVVVMALGEPAGLTGEATSRTKLRLPINQQDLLLAVHRTGKPLVLTLTNGRPLALELENELAHALVEGWSLGTAGGLALADVLFGDAAPAGKLTMSFPRHEGQLPLYYARAATGRPANPHDRWTAKYIDAGGDALFPFGWGLSYTTFGYADLRVEPATVRPGQPVRVTVKVTNAGARDGEEVVQLYVNDPVASVTRPAKLLRGFRKVLIKAGETREVDFRLTDEDFKFTDERGRRVSEPGRMRVLVGGNSVELREAEFRLVK